MTLPALTLDAQVMRAGNATFIEMGGELIMLNVQTSKYYGIQAVGKEIWDMLGDTPVSIRSIVERLLELYEVDEATCSQQVISFLENLRSQQFVQVS